MTAPPPSRSSAKPAETARRHLVLRVPTARAGDSVEDVRRGLSGRAFDCADTVYVVDADGRLQGTMRMTALLAADGGTSLGRLMRGDPPRTHADTDQERVAALARREGLAAVPVVDEAGRLMGVVPPEAIIDVLRREHVEDLHRLAGILHETSQAQSALSESPLRRLRHRLPWLLVGFAGSLMATAVVATFEGTLEAKVALAFFIPAIVYLADAIGTQTEAIAVRGLSQSHAPLMRLLGGELAAGLLIGGALGLLALPAVLVGFGDMRLAVTVALTVVLASTIATTVGLLFPWILSHLGQDPAYGSGPVATIIQDVLSLLIYFLVAVALL